MKIIISCRPHMIVNAGSTWPAAMEETCTAFVLIPEMLTHAGRLQQSAGLYRVPCDLAWQQLAQSHSKFLTCLMKLNEITRWQGINTGTHCMSQHVYKVKFYRCSNKINALMSIFWRSSTSFMSIVLSKFVKQMLSINKKYLCHWKWCAGLKSRLSWC